MGDRVERALEETVPLLRQVRRLKLLSENEILSLVQERRDHEYALVRPGAPRAAFLRYAAFERDLSEKLKKRAIDRSMPEKRARSIALQQAARVNLVYSRAIRKFKGDDALYLHYAKHCINSGSRKAAEKVFARAIAHRGDSEKIWLAAMAFHFDSCGDAKVARAIAQRGLRVLKKSKLMWKEYFRLELAYLAKLVARRVTIGHWTFSNDAQTRPIEVLPFMPTSGTPAQNDSMDLLASENHPLLPSRDSNISTDLSFWEGGVPYAVLKNACEAADFSAGEACMYLQIAASMQFVPSSLLAAIASYLSTKFAFSSSPLLRLILARNSFDIAAARLALLRSVNESRNSSLGGSLQNAELATASDGSESQPTEMELGIVAEDTAFQTVLAVEKLLCESAIPMLEEEQFKSVLDEFCLSVKKSLSTDTAVRVVERCNLALRTSKATNEVAEPPQHPISLDEVRFSQDPARWAKFLEESRACQDSACGIDADIIRKALYEKTAVPFRTQEQLELCVEWLRWESDLQQLREAYDMFLKFPPESDVIIREAIASEKRLHPLDEHRDAMQYFERVRKLYLKLVSLSIAKRDVHIWIEFLKFERDERKSAQGAADVMWRAKHILPHSLYIVLEEQVTLLHML